MDSPLKNYVVTQKFGETITDSKGHTGIDLYQPVGTLVYAAEGGDILEAGIINNNRGNAAYGNCVLIDHRNGYYTFYAHLNEVKVKKGMSVIKGAAIGTVGTTGNVTGPHLHFEVRNNPVWNRNNFIDPEILINFNNQSSVIINPMYPEKNEDFKIGEKVRISGSLVNMRDSAGYSGNVIMELKNGVKLKVVGDKQNRNGLDWYPVQINGYVASTNGFVTLLERDN